LIGVCGIFCGACPIYRADNDSDQELAQKMARQYNLSEDQIHCEGCVSDNTFLRCKVCGFRDCAKQKGLAYCFECVFQPCTKIFDLAMNCSRKYSMPHLVLCIGNLNTLRQEGVHEWLRKQEIRWSCTNCGKRLTWYSQSCPQCGTKFFDAAKEASIIKLS
jgi:hypothetical protein